MDWTTFFNQEKKQPYSQKLHDALDEEYAKYTVYPPREAIFKAFQLTPLEQVKVVIIGQDPYHEPNQAMGLAFSVPKGIKLPPSLINIYKEISNDLGVKMDYSSGDLTYLAKQGVLLLNATLSVRAHEANSHKSFGYQEFFKNVLEYLSLTSQPMVFLLWGRFARNLKKYIHNPQHLILESNHPSPLSANIGGFFHQHHFSKTNDYLKKHNLIPINWTNV